MACHRRFADSAGYTCHCWECAHAAGWHEERTMERMHATCGVDGRRVSKYDSPNNGSSTACECCGYETSEVSNDHDG